MLMMLSIRCKYSVQILYNLHNNFQNLHLYSTKSPIQIPKSPNQSYTNYFIDHLGFSHQQALSTSTKLLSKNGNYSKFTNNANSVVDFLKKHNFDDAHIVKVVSGYPRILAANVDKTIKPKFQLLQDLGFSGSDLVSFITSNPSSVRNNMDMDHFDDLRAILGSNENLIKLFKRAQFFMSTSSMRNLYSNIALLNNEYGVDIEIIRHRILLQPRSFMRTSIFFRNILVRVEKELGIPRNSGVFLYGIQLLCSLSKKSIASKCQLFKSLGWTKYDVSELMRRNPLIFQLSEENIRKKSGFLMTELGYKPDCLATHSVLLTLNLEKRMAPRHRVLSVLKEKGLLDYSFYTAALKNEAQFLKIFIEPFKEDAPGLLELYQSNKGYSNIDAISRHQ